MITRSAWTTALAILLVCVMLTGGADAAKRSDPKIAELAGRQLQIAAKRQQAARKINALTASDKQLTSSLDALAAVETSRVSALEDAQRREREARRRVTLARIRVARAKERVAAAQKLLATSALRQYAGIGAIDILATLSAPDTNSPDRRGVFARLAAGANADVADRLRSARQDEELALVLQKQQSRRAKQARAARATSLVNVRAAKRDRERLTASIEDRLERSLAEAEALASIDGKVSAELKSRQVALIAAIRADEARLAQLQARLGKGTKAGSGGSGSGIYADTSTSRPIVAPPGPPSGSIVSVGGVTVDASIASQLRSLIAAAAADGIRLSGGGYRDRSNQIALRRAHCGSGDYAIFQARASSCRPPTARPGASMHEQGLAIDFTAGGSLITSRSSAPFQWMRSNAARFGLRNLPSEPWHWSTNGN